MLFPKTRQKGNCLGEDRAEEQTMVSITTDGDVKWREIVGKTKIAYATDNVW